MSWKRISVVLAAVVVVAGTLLIRRGVSQRSRHHYQTANVERGAVVARVKASGTLSALVTVQVGSQISGRIAHLSVDFNSKVRKGDELARIDTALLKAAVAQARAARAAARGDLAKARANGEIAAVRLARNRALAERKLIAETDFDQMRTDAAGARADIEAARGKLQEAEAALEQAEVSLTYATILSPIDGVVISRNVDVGQTVAASLQAPTLFTIAGDLREMQVDTNVSEADVGKLVPGMKATFTVDAYPNRTLEGTVRDIRNTPVAIQNVVTYDAVIDVKNPELILKPGMTAHVTFVYAEHGDALRVKNAAFRFRPTSAKEARRTALAELGPDQRVIYRLPKGGKPERVVVTTGLSDGSETEVLGDELKTGDRVIVDSLLENESAARAKRLF